MRKPILIGIGAMVVVMAVACLLLGTAFAKKPSGPPGGGGGGGTPFVCDGAPLEILNGGYGCSETMWIQMYDSTNVCYIRCRLAKAEPGGKKIQCDVTIIGWIGGTVVADPSDEHGFHFDPNTVVVHEVTAEGMQTNICFISANPSLFDGGLWYIPYVPEQVRDL